MALANWWDFSLTPPESVVIAGDWHGNERWAKHVIETASGLLPQRGPRVILHLGDFGVWPGSPFPARIGSFLDDHGMQLWFVDGNHEWHDTIDALHEVYGPGPCPIEKTESIWHLPRGQRWEWHGIRWLAVGGAGSPDRGHRAKGLSWWPQEVITDEQVQRLITGGSLITDVLISHDCPRAFMPPLPPPPREWDLAPCHESSNRLQLITNAVKPMTIFHGHLHVARNDVMSSTWGTIEVNGLDADGVDGNYLLLDTRKLAHHMKR